MYNFLSTNLNFLGNCGVEEFDDLRDIQREGVQQNIWKVLKFILFAIIFYIFKRD